ncbi:MAG TPA: hypothetical protein VEH04_11310 [Verrucomicrobiae bacterium]|nr:hypothetical protein [Verrucomicrobiae bacterium]
MKTLRTVIVPIPDSDEDVAPQVPIPFVDLGLYPKATYETAVLGMLQAGEITHLQANRIRQMLCLPEKP